MHGDPVTVEGTHLLARCVQHETDHLDGVLFIDRLDPATRKEAMKMIRESDWFGPHDRQDQPTSSAERSMRVVFAGTPEVAVVSLEAVLASRHGWSRWSPARMLWPDAGAGSPPPVSRAASERGIPVLTPTKPSDPEFVQTLRELQPDCCPVVAYGALIPQPVLDIPAHGWVNLHFAAAGMAGAAPVQRAIMGGDDVTGAAWSSSWRRAWTPARCSAL